MMVTIVQGVREKERYCLTEPPKHPGEILFKGSNLQLGIR